MKTLLESNPLKSKILVRRLAIVPLKKVPKFGEGLVTLGLVDEKGSNAFYKSDLLPRTLFKEYDKCIEILQESLGPKRLERIFPSQTDQVLIPSAGGQRGSKMVPREYDINITTTTTTTTTTTATTTTTTTATTTTTTTATTTTTTNKHNDNDTIPTNINISIRCRGTGSSEVATTQYRSNTVIS